MKLSLNGSDWQVLGLPPSEWAWRRLGEDVVDLDHIAPGVPPWLPAVVPGDVQSDLQDAGENPDFTRDLDSRACEWASHRDWVYRKEFDVGAEHAGRTVRLRFESVDYACHVFLNGRHLGDHEGTYTPFEFDVTDALNVGGRNRLIVVVEHAPSEPEVQGQIGWTNRIRRWKPRFAYGWDWCTRLVPLGIVDDVSLLVTGEAYLADVWVRPMLVPDEAGNPFGEAELVFRFQAWSSREQLAWISVDLACGDQRERWRTSFPLKEGLIWGEYVPVLDRPQLWHPNGSGAQPLYTARVTLEAEDGRALDERTVRFGIRQVRAVPNDDAPEGALPYVLEVNGQKTFIKGWNWAPIDQLYGRAHEQEYRHAIRMAREAHCNLLRVWGGGLLERELFYDLCDEAGIMVWQEFHQSSSGINNEPPSDPEYVAYVRDQARQIVPRRRNHPCLVIYCGGNELFTPDGVPLGNDHPTLAALKAVVEEMDPDRIFLPTSPSGPVFAALPENVGKMHDVHGHWLYMGDPEHYRFYNVIDPLLHSEFGVEGAANLPALRRFLSEKYLWPPDSTNPAWVHHGAWWINRPTVEKLFGPLDNLEDFVKASQWLQAEGLRYAVEATRRRKWRTSGSMPWQFNEAWPNASCTNALDYWGHPKPAYWTMKNAYAPFLVSAEYEKLAWQPGEAFRARVRLNASRPLPAGAAVRWEWRDALTGVEWARGAAPAPADDSAPCAAWAADVAAEWPGAPALGLLRLALADGAGATLATNDYLFSSFSESPFRTLLQVARAVMKPEVLDGGFRVRADGLLCGVQALVSGDYAGPYLSAGYAFVLLPGEEWTLRADGAGTVCVSAWNADPVEIEVG